MSFVFWNPLVDRKDKLDGNTLKSKWEIITTMQLPHCTKCSPKLFCCLRFETQPNFMSKIWNVFRSRRWGSSLPGLNTLDPPFGAPSTWAEIFRRTCLQSNLQTSPPTPQKSYPKFRNPRTTFENTPLCPPKYSIVRGVGGSQILLRVWNPQIFVT